MAVVSRTVFLGVFLCWIITGVWSRPNGAPTTACVSMLPNHGVPSQAANTSPFTVTADTTDFTTEQVITVTVSSGGSVTFKGVLLQARVVDTDTPVGVFSNIPDGYQPLNCSSADDAVTHANNNVKNSLTVEWTAPSNALGDIEFVATVVYTREIFWSQLRSSVITALPDVCLSEPCFNGGTCYRASDKRSYFCGCTAPSEMGPNCETACSPNPCLNGGVCREAGDTFSCFCPSDRHGARCEFEIITCDPDPCLNGASCLATATGHECICAFGWSGDDCGTSLICQADSCLNGGTCFDSNPPGSVMFYCYCNVYYTGSRCETADPCRADPCANSGTCNQVGDTEAFTCSCIDGFEGERCETTTNPCQASPCMNGGTCFRDTNGATMCQCPSDYIGDVCQTRVHPCDLPVTPCMNEGTCFKGSSGYSYFCQCPSGYSGMDCETLDDPCASHPCMNGASCTPGSGEEYTCTCPAEFFGSNCQNRGACFGADCQNGGTCIPRSDQLAFTCQCAPSYDGPYCQYANGCELNDLCLGGSTCSYIGQGFTRCDCPDGLAGTYCELDVSCSGTPCRNGGTCRPLGDGSYQCDCLAIYSGSNCEIYTNPCMPDPCVNSECIILLDPDTAWNCTCGKDYSGENCTIYNGDPCDVFECFNDGQCISGAQGSTCVCGPDYSGEHCERPLNPTLTGCPSGLAISYPLQQGSNSAYIDLSITARGHLNQLIPITVTDELEFPSTIMFTEEYREGKDITVQAVDENNENRTSTCSFKLRILDNEIPTVQCPADMSTITAENSVAVFFPMATAMDNLGITKPLQYTPSNGSQFDAGRSHTVIVKALDTFDNQGECSFQVVVNKKESDCTEPTAPDNGVSTCVADGESRTCSVSCNEGFGNAVGINEYMCVHQSPAYWTPRPNTDICVPYKPGNSASKVVSLRFSIDSALCNTLNFDNSVADSLTESLQALGVCETNDARMSCSFELECGSGSGAGRRRRANVDLNVDLGLTSLAGEDDSTADVEARLDGAVDNVKAGVATSSLSIEIEGETIMNEPTALGESDTTWNCKPGQVTKSNGCLSCPPGTYHDAVRKTCSYCETNTHQNKPEQESCSSCPDGTETQQNGAFSEDHCVPIDKEPLAGPWTPTLIGIVGGAGGLIVLLLVILACVCIVKSSRRPSHESRGESKESPLSNFTHLNKAYEETDETEMQFHGDPSIDSDNTYQNIVDDDQSRTGSTDYLVRIPSLSQYSDYYATLNARSAPNLEPETPPPPPPVSAPAPPEPQLNGGPPSPPPAPPAPPAPGLNTNNSNMSTDHTHLNGSVANGGTRAKFQV
ncbi:sushi, von Willebrand factor type A, EGF and pentraxin domain-containing protein 1-like isoform X2 [Patiria miniata]|uniref:Uncharacterized protein n=1 Tax=Patiria miniata TaxID=46514 RepID=A0A914BKN7_PATMI|nr:sushi, von Willebrand factor type A, EGF and pentraxin domain-containing protein 1-like isoform X2 [Patiria miniata]